jgi:ElaB/YqjD/DUF883 family membrane-anchored ribosome-binding protein
MPKRCCARSRQRWRGLQEHAEDTLRDLKGRLAGLEQQLNARARDVDSYVRENPWQAVAVAGGVALLLGLIMARR